MAKQYQLFEVPITGQPTPRRKPVDIKRNKVDHDIAKRRYYLHRRLDKKMFKNIDFTNRHIDSEYSSFEAIPRGQRYYIGQLIEMGYNVQYKIL